MRARREGGGTHDSELGADVLVEAVVELGEKFVGFYVAVFEALQRGFEGHLWLCGWELGVFAAADGEGLVRAWQETGCWVEGLGGGDGVMGGGARGGRVVKVAVGRGPGEWEEVFTVVVAVFVGVGAVAVAVVMGGMEGVGVGDVGGPGEGVGHWVGGW